ncbi:MAG: gliding motility lipoprotein GldH [Bacteroidales bacterium]
MINVATKMSCFLCISTIFVVIFGACSKNVVYEYYKPIENKIWHKDSLITFYVPIEDTLSNNTIYINLRNTSAYPYCNIFFFITTYLPTGVYIKDTVEYMLADQYGKWYGKGFSHLLDNRLLYQKQVHFPQSGVYRFEIQQGMRNETLQYISDVGICIEKE